MPTHRPQPDQQEATSRLFRQVLFRGYHPPTSNTTYAPNQFFDVVLPHFSRGVVRLVAYMIRKTLGWCDQDGNPQETEILVTYRDLVEHAGISRDMIRQAIDEATAAHFIRCVRPGRAKGVGVSAESALFELCWNDSGPYTTDPKQFRGFFAGEGHRTYIPNDFFDETVRNESLAVVRVVGAIIRHTIGFQTRYGFRRQQVRLSVSDLVRITRLNRDTVRLALHEAMARGYLVRVEPGCFDRAGGKDSRAAVYGLRWQDGFGAQEEEPLRKPVRHHSETPHGERSENRHGTEITGNNRIEKRRQAAAWPPQLLPLVEQLEALGFDRPSVRDLMTRFPAERIERQLQWLPKRNPQRNARGLLKRAIEQDWPEPRVELPQTPAVRFAAGFYAGWSGSKGQALARPTANDIAAAEPYLDKLLAIQPEPAQAEGWGREFGAHARRAEQGRRNPLCSLVHALRLHGDAFHQVLVERRHKAERLARVAAQREHEAKHQASYMAYLSAEEASVKLLDPEAYGAFIASEQRQREFVTRNGLSSSTVASCEREEARLMRFQLHFANDLTNPVLGFWGWDERYNPEPFRSYSTSASPSSASSSSTVGSRPASSSGNASTSW